jgi:drug/metabolite transporter (DMT)-like permease
LPEKQSFFNVYVLTYLWPMKTKYLKWALLLVGSLVLTGLCIRSLALQGLPYYHSLSSRGFFCLLLVIGFGRFKQQSLIPKALKVQIFRALLAGLALSFFTLSYNWLTASAVAVLSNIDVPLLIVLAPFLGMKASGKTRGLSLISISFLVCYVSSLEAQPNLQLGLATLGIGSVLLCFGYLFIKKSMAEENEAVTIAVPSLAIIFYGIVQGLFSDVATSTITAQMVLEAFFSGVGMFFAYYATMKLYSLTDLASAEFPTLISSIVIQPLEYLFLDSAVELTYLLSSIGFVLITFWIMQDQHRSHATA